VVAANVQLTGDKSTAGESRVTLANAWSGIKPLFLANGRTVNKSPENADLNEMLPDIEEVSDETGLIEETPPGTWSEVASPSIADESHPAARVFHSSMPVELPAPEVKLNHHLNIIQSFEIEWIRLRSFPIRIEKLYLPKRPACDGSINNGENKDAEFIAFIDEAKRKSKRELSRVGKSIALILKCENEARKAATENQATPSPEENTFEGGETRPTGTNSQGPQFNIGSIQP
jgi:hypothetical protein